MDACGVCLEAFTKKLRLEHVCAYCTKKTCLFCLKAFVLSTLSEPHCLHCRRAFTQELVDAAFSPNFRKHELRKHRIKILMEQEKSLFPATLAEIEREDAQAAYMASFAKHSQLIQRFSPRDVAPLNPQLIQEINDTRVAMAALLERVQELGGAHEERTQRREFVRKCPSCPDGLLSSGWKCPLCHTKVCKHCLAVRTDEHECNPQDVESAKTIEAETKPCPHCGVRVQKAEGCNQMWCTACNNAFDWRTGQKVNGPIHNPHFHEYQRHHAPQANAWRDACENEHNPNHWPWLYSQQLLNFLVHRVGPLTQTWISKVSDVNRLMIERAASAQEYVDYSPAMYEDLRKKRLRRQIDDADWARQLSLRETKREKQLKIRLLDQLLLAIGRDTLAAFSQETSPARIDEVFMQPLEAARAYYNHQMKLLFDKKPLQINDRWLTRTL
jgi:hypothetical protein